MLSAAKHPQTGRSFYALPLYDRGGFALSLFMLIFVAATLVLARI